MWRPQRLSSDDDPIEALAKVLAPIVVVSALLGLSYDSVHSQTSEFLDAIHGTLGELNVDKDELELAAETCYEQGRFVESADLYSRAIQRRPNRSSLYFGRGMAYEMIDRPDKAIQDYQKALQVDPDNYQAMENLAGLYERSGHQIEHVIHLYKRALELDPRAMWKENLAVWIKILETRLQPEISSAVASWHLGVEKERGGKLGEAESLYSRAIELDPRLFQAYYCRALLRLKTDDAEGAMADLNATVDLYPGFRGALILRGTLHEQLGNAKQALDDFKLATHVDARDPLAHYHLGRMLEQEGELAGALESYQETLRWKPNRELHRLAQERIAAVNAGLNPLTREGPKSAE
jgi:tetratricopeptide (TPR) repeat protein